uniref:Putative secreted protein n=1 Tax=Anopheles triannulatus TaxID=58253 RepID=A0A2M4B4U1_9DIPT
MVILCVFSIGGFAMTNPPRECNPIVFSYTWMSAKRKRSREVNAPRHRRCTPRSASTSTRTIITLFKADAIMCVHLLVEDVDHNRSRCTCHHGAKKGRKDRSSSLLQLHLATSPTIIIINNSSTRFRPRFLHQRAKDSKREWKRKSESTIKKEGKTMVYAKRTKHRTYPQYIICSWLWPGQARVHDMVRRRTPYSTLFNFTG